MQQVTTHAYDRVYKHQHFNTRLSHLTTMLEELMRSSKIFFNSVMYISTIKCQISSKLNDQTTQN